MKINQHQIEIASAEALQITDAELQSILTIVYVDGGYTSPADAETLFEPASVRKRGFLIGARDSSNSELAGVIILVPPNSPAKRLAQDNEAEIHLLGVKPAYRGHNLGRKLMDAVFDLAAQKGYSKIILWTQMNMHSAQKIYETAGFAHVSFLERNGKQYKVYEKNLASSA